MTQPTVSQVHYEKLARYAKALAHPTRLAIVHFLAEHEHCYFYDIHERLPVAKATVSQHLKELREAGLIIGIEEPPKVKYCLNSDEWETMRSLFAEFFDMCGCRHSQCHCPHS